MATLAPPDPVVAAADVRRHRAWLVMLLAGSVVWLASAVITAATHNLILVPTVILVGSFLVPVTVVAWALELPREDQIGAGTVLTAFLVSGTVGLLAAALVETYVLPTRNATFVFVGLIEEAAKALILVLVGRQVRMRGPIDGMVLGAVVGAGFAAFESSGYAFNTLVEHAYDKPIINVLETQISRAVLSPFGHILWTALVGAALFAGVTAVGSFRITRITWTFVGVVVLHGAWDAAYGVSILVTEWLNGEGWRWSWPNVVAWMGTPSDGEILVFNIVYDVLLGINALIGSWWVVRRYRHHRRHVDVGDEQAVDARLS